MQSTNSTDIHIVFNNEQSINSTSTNWLILDASASYIKSNRSENIIYYWECLYSDNPSIPCPAILTNQPKQFIQPNTLLSGGLYYFKVKGSKENHLENGPTKIIEVNISNYKNTNLNVSVIVTRNDEVMDISSNPTKSTIYAGDFIHISCSSDEPVVSWEWISLFNQINFQNILVNNTNQRSSWEINTETLELSQYAILIQVTTPDQRKTNQILNFTINDPPNQGKYTFSD